MLAASAASLPGCLPLPALGLTPCSGPPWLPLWLHLTASGLNFSGREKERGRTNFFFLIEVCFDLSVWNITNNLKELLFLVTSIPSPCLSWHSLILTLGRHSLSLWYMCVWQHWHHPLLEGWAWDSVLASWPHIFIYVFFITLIPHIQFMSKLSFFKTHPRYNYFSLPLQFTECSYYNPSSFLTWYPPSGLFHYGVFFTQQPAWIF